MNDEAQFRLLLTVVVAATLGIAGLIALVLLYHQQQQLRHRERMRKLEEQHQRELLKASLQAQEAERRRLAADLHDDVGTMLSATRMSLAQANRHAGDNPAVEAMVRQTRDLLEETVNNVRRITKELLPSTLDDLGLLAALDEFHSRLRLTFPAVTIVLHTDDYDERLAPPIELALYRVAQELVHNSLRHANATRIEVLLLRQTNRVLLTVSDNGVGFCLEVARQPGHKGLGLKNIESRLNVIGGRAIFDVAPGKGANVIVDVPLPNALI
jgi:signal transduction histidine kinase